MLQAIMIVILVLVVYVLSYTIAYITSVNSEDIKNKHIKKIIKNKGNYIVRVDLSITMIEFVISTLVVDTYAKSIINIFNIKEGLLQYVIIILTTMIFAYIITIVGKYLPKYIAIQNKENINKYYIYLAIIISEIFFPFTVLLNYIYNKLSKNLNKKGLNELNAYDIIKVANISYDKKVLNKTERDLILNSVKLNELKAEELVRDINDCIYLEKDDNIDKLMKLYKEHNYTRFPVVNMKKGTIIGIINIIDIFNDLIKIKSRKNKITKYIKEPLYISINSKLTTIYNKLRVQDAHIAVLYDNNNIENTVGIITVEDILEELI